MFYPIAGTLINATLDRARALAENTDPAAVLGILDQIHDHDCGLDASPPRSTAAGLLRLYLPESTPVRPATAPASALVRQLIADVRVLCDTFRPTDENPDQDPWNRVTAGLNEVMDDADDIRQFMGACLLNAVCCDWCWDPYEADDLFRTVHAHVFQARQGFWQGADGSWLSSPPVCAN